VTIVESTTYDTARIRADFPILGRRLAGDLPLVYLDSANTSQKPESVIRAIDDHYRLHNANVARAMHQLGAEASAAFELGRDKVATFIGAPNRDEVVFAKNASEALNLVARVLGDSGRIGQDHEIVITEMEHHSNIVPWQQLSQRTGATLRWFGVTDEGRLDLDSIDQLITEQTAVVSVTWVSNMLGTINPLDTIIAKAHSVGALVVVDASQAVPQLPVDVAALGADFVAFTGHKMVGPTGIGVLWGRYDLLAELPPFLGGGEMIETVTMAESTYAPPPSRFEAGTPPIAQAVGLGAAVDYLTSLGMENVAAHEQEITAYALGALQEIDGLTVVGPKTAVDRGGAVSFTLDEIHPHDVSQLLDSKGIAVRAGHHCAKPAHLRFGVQSTTRASFYLYTTTQEIDALVEALHHTKKYFS
jgi:cysteine desulfurase/selenocysteine lyase